MTELRFRQIHLDFHTSGLIPDVGGRFDPKQFQEMLRLGHVDSINLFSKCHHGHTYHDTSVGVRHPTMREELLPRQMDACRAIDVKTPIYISAGLDDAAIRHHPEWSHKSKEGVTYQPLIPGFKLMCFNTPYLDYLCAQIEEVADKFDGGDGIWLDIIGAHRCYCPFCLAGMLAQGLDATDEAQVDIYAEQVLQKYYQKTTAASKKGDPDRHVFHNSGHIPKGAANRLHWNSHLELESLPTGGWGYDHFPVSAKYAATTGYDFLGMTGKFHTNWGEFGGFKRPNALRYECAAMLAFGSKCCIGDQLHPVGVMNPDTYSLVGAAYSEVEAKEQFCHGAHPTSEIAVVSPEALGSAGGHTQTSDAETGAARMLLEMHAQFDVIDLDRDLSLYKLVILPDEIILTGAFADKVKTYAANGGKLLLSGKSGLNPTCDAFAVDTGATLKGASPWNPDYLIATDALPTPRVRGRMVIHGGAWDVEPGAGTEILAHRADPYFNRTWDHFCSHYHTPDAEQSRYPGIIRHGSTIYFAHDIFTRYRLYGQPLYRDLVQDAIRLLIGEPSVRAELPTAARVSLMRQPEDNRYVLHLLYGVPVLRGSRTGDNAWSVEVIEDLVPLNNVACTVRVPETVTSARLAPSGEELPLTKSGDGALTFTVPQIFCHQMVTLTY